LGIAQRQVHVNHPISSGNQQSAKALKLNIKTAGDWLKIKRLERNLTPGRVAAKMGIATPLVSSWENGDYLPDRLQLKVLATVLDFDTKDFEVIAKNVAAWCSSKLLPCV
jgi:DNA-binding transcriptional regulator YiaG